MSNGNTRQIIDVPGLADSTGYGYQQCIRVGDLVYVAGQVGVDEHYNVVSEDIGEQARLAFRNVQLALRAAGGDLEDLVSMTVFLTDMEHNFHPFIAVRNEVLKAPALPTSAAIGVSALALPTLKVEIQSVAHIPARG